MRILIILTIGLITLSTANAQFKRPPPSPIAQKIQAAIHSEVRSDADKARDENRKPVQTLEFFGLEEDMRVLELVPEGGWYTKILAPVLADKGQLYLAIGTRQLGDLLERSPALGKAKVLPLKVSFEPTEHRGIFKLGEFTLGVEDIDLALTFRNLHNFDEPSQQHIHQAVFEALKPGGRYGIIDHTRRHNEPFATERWRRLDPVTVIRQVEQAGFEFVDSSDLHYRPDDELRYDTTRKTVRHNSDRFVLLFQKPLNDKDQ